MKLTEEQRKEFLEAAKPLIKWLNDHCHPNFNAIVDQYSIELSECIVRSTTEEFLKD